MMPAKEQGGILVVGATGQLGTVVVRKAVASGIPVRALVRPSSDFLHLHGSGAEVAFGDLRDVKSLERACEGVRAVISTATVIFPRGRYSFDEDERVGYRNLLAACRHQGVSQFAFVSIVSYPEYYVTRVPTLRYKAIVEQLVQTSGVTYTIFRAGAFMDDYFALIGSSIPLRGAEAPTLRRPFWFSRAFLRLVSTLIETRGTALLPAPKHARVAFIALDDVASFLVRAVGHAAAANACFEIGGPEALSWGDVVELYASVLGRPVRAITMPSWLSRLSMMPVGLLSPAAANQLGILWALGRNEILGDGREVARLFGVRLTTAEEFLRAKMTLPAAA